MIGQAFYILLYIYNIELTGLVAACMQVSDGFVKLEKLISIKKGTVYLEIIKKLYKS